MQSLLKYKKASLADPIFTGAYILKTVVVILIMLFVWVSFQALMQVQIVGSPAETTLNSVMTTLRNAYFSMDYVFPLFVGGLLIVSLVFAYKTGTNIVWGILSIISWIIALILSFLFVNVYLSISSAFPTIYVAMPVMDFIMTNLHWFTLFWLALISIVMFRKNNVEDEMSETQRRVYGR